MGRPPRSMQFPLVRIFVHADTACAGKSTKVKLSASGKRCYWLLQVLFRSIDGLTHGHAGRARVPVSVPETNARQEPLRYQDGERSDFFIPDVHVISRFASPTQIINGSSYKQTSPLSRAKLPRHPIIAASKPGKLADGSQYLTTRCNGSSDERTTTVLCLCFATSYKEWGRFFRRFRFRYLKEAQKFYQATVITHHPRAGDYQHTQSGGQIWHKGSYSTHNGAGSGFWSPKFLFYGGGQWFTTPQPSEFGGPTTHSQKASLDQGQQKCSGGASCLVPQSSYH